ncbi:MAG: methyltransferase domain-containing protein, partial [Ramlibacter sp.]
MTYSRVVDHHSMVFDANRNEAYAHAIRQLVRPGSVVLDLGAGLGLHGLLAAAAGAARVYLVEPQGVVQTALEAARAAGFADRIVVLQERIEDVQLPEPVDLIVSVFTGNLLFSEDLLPSLFHARDRYLKPGGSLLPDRAELWLAPLSAPNLHDKHVARWQDPVMGLDYSSARALAANEILWLRRDEFAGAT